MACHIRRALASPDTEHARDVWDLAVFGHGGGLSFTGISQPWLRQAAKRWARAELPRHRGADAGNVREAVNSLGWLSGSLRARPDHGDAPAVLGRADIENFLNRLAYCQSAGKISHYRRVAICRDIQRILPQIRALALSGSGRAADKLAGGFVMQPGDVPAERAGRAGTGPAAAGNARAVREPARAGTTRDPGRRPDRDRHRAAARRHLRAAAGLPRPR